MHQVLKGEYSTIDMRNQISLIYTRTKLCGTLLTIWSRNQREHKRDATIIGSRAEVSGAFLPFPQRCSGLNRIMARPQAFLLFKLRRAHGPPHRRYPPSELSNNEMRRSKL